MLELLTHTPSDLIHICKFIPTNYIYYTHSVVTMTDVSCKILKNCDKLTFTDEEGSSFETGT